MSKETSAKSMSLKKAFMLSNRAFKLFSKKYPQMAASRLISVIWNALTPYVEIFLSAMIIDELSAGRNAERLKLLVLLTLCSVAVIALVGALLNKWKETQNAGIWLKVEDILSEKMLNMDYSCLDETNTSDQFSAINQNGRGGGWGLFNFMVSYERLISSVLTIIGGIALTVTLFTCTVPSNSDGLLFLNNPFVVICFIAIMVGVTISAPMLNNKASSYWSKYSDLSNLGNRLFNFFGWLCYINDYAADMRIYCQNKICEHYNRNKESTFLSKGLFAHFARGAMGLYSAAGGAVSVLFTGVIYAFVCLKALAGAFGLGSVTLYIASVTKVSKGMSGIVWAIGYMRNNAHFLELTFDFLDIPNKMYQGSLTVEKRRDRNYQVEFRNVSFKYPGSDNYALHNVSMKFEIGKRLAVVGMNGSGKTTFIKLLCRLYDPTEGEILLNGIDIRKYNYREYMNIFSVVFQDFKLLGLKLGENVASGTDYDKFRVLDCLEKAGFSDRLAEMSDGIDTYLYKEYDSCGIDVSGGEAQKIAIARALYKDAPFIILDEPTAALDPIAEAEIYSRFDEIAGDKTAIYISHRLSTCKFCDEIIIFHDGAVVEQGTHAELVNNKTGKYFELWNAQAQYYSNPIKQSNN